MMNQKEIFKKVGGILSELNEQYDYLSKSPENLNELELELFSANASFLSDHISILVKLGAVAPKSSPAEEAAPRNPMNADAQEADSSFSFDFRQESSQPEIIESEHIENTSVDEPTLWSEPSTNPVIESPNEEAEEVSATKESFDPETAHTEALPIEPQLAEVEEKISSLEPEAILPVSASPQTAEVERSVIVPEEVQPEAKQLEEKQPEERPARTVNDILGNRSQQNTTPQFAPKPAGDLKTMISLNDKLLFVKDLFNGYSLAYSEAIELLNRFDTFEAAENFLIQNYAAKNRWADKQSTADRFYEVLNKRFSR